MGKRFDAQPKATVSPDPTTCKGCRFWVERGETVGECRRFPPAGGIKQPTAFGPLTLSVITAADHYCGEHQPRPGR